MNEEKRIEEKIKELANERTISAVQYLFPQFVSIVNERIGDKITNREEIIAQTIMYTLLKQIIVASIDTDDAALEKIAEEVFNEMGDELQ